MTIKPILHPTISLSNETIKVQFFVYRYVILIHFIDCDETKYKFAILFLNILNFAVF